MYFIQRRYVIVINVTFFSIIINFGIYSIFEKDINHYEIDIFHSFIKKRFKMQIGNDIGVVR